MTGLHEHTFTCGLSIGLIIERDAYILFGNNVNIVYQEEWRLLALQDFRIPRYGQWSTLPVAVADCGV